MSDQQPGAPTTALERLMPTAKRARLLRIPAFFEIPEGETLELYAEPMTLEDFDKIAKASGGSAFLEVVETIVRKVLKGDGTKFFQLRDKGRLLNDIPATVLRELYDQIVDRPERFDTVVGKSEATKS